MFFLEVLVTEKVSRVSYDIFLVIVRTVVVLFDGGSEELLVVLEVLDVI